MLPFISTFKKWGLISLLALMLVLFIYFHLYDYLNLESIKHYQTVLQNWTNAYYPYVVAVYLLVFIILIAATIPAATLLTLLGGFLFGSIAIVYAILGITLGGLILCFAIRTSIGAHIAGHSSVWIKKMEKGFQNNAFFYLLMLRLMPICPCWISNIAAGALNVPIRTFILATIIGVTPATVIYVFAGRGLEQLLSSNTGLSLNFLMAPSIIIPLIGLACLSIFPVVYKQLKKDQENRYNKE